MLYAEAPRLRRRQVAGDLAALAWIVLWLVLAAAVHRLVLDLAVPGEELAAAGASFSTGVSRFSGAIEGVPFIGAELTAAFLSLQEGAIELIAVGEEVQVAARRMALLAAVIVGVLPTLLAVVPHLWSRVAWARRAATARRLRDDPATLRLLALRALLRQPLDKLRAVSEDPVGDLDERPQVLARLELADLGLRPRA